MEREDMGCEIGNFAHWNWWVMGGMFMLAGAAVTWLGMVFYKKKNNINADRLDSMEIIKSRLANGEISIEEFNVLKKIL
ncbi:SHOCT domain-containing protein [uncultured Desulfovibrio sp.]|uniref:SHOCT domain-containing protein n=1 Tax=Desulfovibrio sp. TaxID=885 RepID=UPI00260F9B85|nr:SHOCT domain-containing protein [uncultured Desulfovibrio sp.]